MAAVLAVMVGLLAAAVSAPPVAAHAAGPTTGVGPQGPSPKVERLTVSNGWSVVDVGFPDLVEDLAEVTFPRKGSGAGAGALPVVLFLHGQHQYCYSDDSKPRPGPAWCGSAGNTLVSSYRGYRYLADALAKQGNIVISVSPTG